MHQRIVPLAGPANFRDVGGYENRHGRHVRTGRVFRSDSLSHMTDGDVAHCVEVLGIRTVVDLRAGHEVDEFSHGPLEAAGVTFHHQPVIDETRRIGEEDAIADLTVDRVYLMMLERFGDRFARVLRLIADGAKHPLVFHCAAGQDRTGITAALMLSLLDVHDEIIATDYALSAETMEVLVERHRRRAEASGRRPEVAEHWFVPDAAAMRALLADLTQTYGSVERFVLAAGLDRSSIASLRDALLE